MSRITTRRLILGELDTQNGKGSEKTVLSKYTASNLALKNGKVPTTVKGNIKLN